MATAKHRRQPPPRGTTFRPLRPRRTEAKRCQVTGKVSWKTQFDAALALGSARYRVIGPKVEQRFYKCEHGDHWHLTAQPERPRPPEGTP